MRALDLFCGAGGASMGYHQSGYELLGVDHRPQPRYPFSFVRADALEFLAAARPGEFDLIHASPPCQQYSAASAGARSRGRCYADLVAPIRRELQRIGGQWVIENVPAAPMAYHVTLCGTMFNLRVYRHRRFETSYLCWQPEHPPHRVPATGSQGRQRKACYQAGMFATITGNGGSHWGDAMEINWMTGRELSQAIPPAYTRWIAEQLR